MGLPYGEEIMIVGRTMWTQSTSVTDRRTDRRTDGRTELRSQRPCNAERRTAKMPATLCTLRVRACRQKSDNEELITNVKLYTACILTVNFSAPDCQRPSGYHSWTGGPHTYLACMCAVSVLSEADDHKATPPLHRRETIFHHHHHSITINENRHQKMYVVMQSSWVSSNI